MARIRRSGDTDEAITIPRPHRRSTIQLQQTSEATMHETHSPLRVLPDRSDLERIVTHGSRCEERCTLQLLATERPNFDALETRHWSTSAPGGWMGPRLRLPARARGQIRPLVTRSQLGATPPQRKPWFTTFIDLLVAHGADQAVTVAAVDRLADLFTATYLGWWDWAARRDPVLAQLGLAPDPCPMDRGRCGEGLAVRSVGDIALGDVQPGVILGFGTIPARSH